MKVIGNEKLSNKFYVRSSNGLEWVPNINLAKRYVINPLFKEWYGKDIYCTNENIIRGKDGKLYLASEIPEDLLISDIDYFEVFKKQGKEYIDNYIQRIIEKNDFKNINEVLSWFKSSLKEYSEFAQKISKFRDACYIHYLDYLKMNEKQLKNNIHKTDFEMLIKSFIDTLPKWK